MATDQPEPGTDAVVARLLANHRRFLDFLTARVGRREDAEEILQEAFVRGLQKAGEIRDDESAVAWFYRDAAARPQGPGHKQYPGRLPAVPAGRGRPG